MKQQSGFTLIELIMVIVILGILAATALPKFTNLSSDARTAAIKAVEGSMRAANSIIYAKAAMANAISSVAQTITVGNVTGVSVTYGFATNISAISSVMDTTSDFVVAGQQMRFAAAGDPANCGVTYTAVSTASGVPAYATVTSGC